MIDYEKLKIAHDLAIKWQLKSESPVILTFMITGFQDNRLVEMRMSSKDGHTAYDSIDILIEKLTELTKPESKYKVGDGVWFYTTRKGICNLIIDEIDPEAIEKYLCNNVWYQEHELFPTKESLIEAQIKYWTEMREPEECQHESDTFAYPSGSDEPLGWRDQIRCKCIKCGEFYR